MTKSVSTVAAIVGVAVVVMISFFVGPVWGHAFEVEHRPAHGARLDRPPEQLLLQFSEAVIRDGVEVTVRLATEDPVPIGSPRLEVGDRVVRVALLDPPTTGVYLVAWHVVSAVDGHETAGEFVFAVGEVAGALPGALQEDESLPLWRGVGTWLLLAGLSLGGGSLVVLRFLPVASGDRGLVSWLAQAGLGGALAGAAAHLVSAAASAAASGATAAWGTTPNGLASLTVALLAGALALAWRRRAPAVALGAVALAGAAWSARSHAAAYGGVAGGFIDFLHLASAAGWVGSLAVVAVVLWRSGGGSGEARLRLARSYARIALPLVVVVAGTGVVSATQLVDRLTDLVTTGYGRLLVAKSAFVTVALAMAMLGRLRGLRHARLPLLRGVTASEAGLLVGVLMLTAALTNTGPPVGRAEMDTLLGPPPLEEPVARAAGLAGSLTVSVAATGDQVHVQVFGPSGGIDGAQIHATAHLPDGRAVDLLPRICGAGCFTQQLDVPRGVTTIMVDADAPDWTGGQFEGQLVWPPAPTDPELLRDLVERMREVPELELSEQVSSGPEATSPETVATLTGEAFLEVMPYGAGEAVAVRPVAGEPDAIEFHMPAARMWFTVWLDDEGRVREQRLVNPGHDIHHRVRYPAA